MTKYSAVVKERETGKIVLLENYEYETKKSFIEDIRGNGYTVNPNKVKISEVFDYIMNNTNCEPCIWKKVNKIVDCK